MSKRRGSLNGTGYANKRHHAAEHGDRRYGCQQNCPLRLYDEPYQDPPLPSPAEVVNIDTSVIAEALYTPIYDWQTRLLILEACNVIVWLGEHGEHTKLVLDYLSWWAKLEPCDNEDYHIKEDFCSACSDNHHPSCADNAKRLIQGLEDLCNRKWVSRIWVRQEVWVAQAVHVRCGSSVFPFDDFRDCSHVRVSLRQPRTDDSEDGRTSTGYVLAPHIDHRHVYALRGLHQQHQMPINELDGGLDGGQQWLSSDNPHMIITLLNQAAASHCTLPTDRIFALLGMAGIGPDTSDGADCRSTTITIDYHKSVEQVFIELAIFLIENVGISSLLNAEGTFGNRKGQTLPSWVPDWRYPLRPFCTSGGLTLTSDDTPAPHEAKRGTNVDAGILRVKGHTIATLRDFLPLSEVPLSQSLSTFPVMAPTRPYKTAQRQLEEGTLCVARCKAPLWFQQAWLDEAANHYRLSNESGGRGIGSLLCYLDLRNQIFVQPNSLPGDMVVILDTAKIPVVLRRDVNTGKTTFVGCAWLLEMSDDRIASAAWLDLESFPDTAKARQWPVEVFDII